MRSNCLFYALKELLSGRARSLRWIYSPHWWGHFHVGVIGHDGRFRHYHPVELNGGRVKDIWFEGHVLDFATAKPFDKCGKTTCECHTK